MGKVLAISVIVFLVVLMLIAAYAGITQTKSERGVCAEHGMEKLQSMTTKTVMCINYTTQQIGYYKWDRE